MLFALDIDGTLTAEHGAVPLEVCKYLQSLSEQGNQIIFITGRTLARTKEMLKGFKFEFHIAVQNGAQIFRYPSGVRTAKRFLPEGILSQAKEFCKEEGLGIALYAGDIQKDICYYCPADYEADVLKHVRARAQEFGEEWKEVENIETFESSHFPALKLIGHKAPLECVVPKFEALGIEMQVIRDPFKKGMYVAQGTAAGVNKGTALQSFHLNGEKVIAAGDDRNDLSMLEKADLKVVMETAPEEVLAHADIVAKSARELGIIDGLKEAALRMKG